MSRAWILGVGATRFSRWPERGFRDLSEEAVRGAVRDAGLEDGQEVEQVWFGNCGMGTWGQANVRGQVALANLFRNGWLRPHAPTMNVEGGCATGSAAFHGAVKDILSGQAHLSLAVGTEKTYVAHDKAKILELFSGGIDRLHPEEWETFFQAAASSFGDAFTPSAHRVLFVDVHAMQARWHMKTFGTTPEQLAFIASKNHGHGARNPRAQYQREQTPEEILLDHQVVSPFTRSMCAPMSDGSAAVLVCSDRFLSGCPPEIRARAVEIRTSTLVAGTWRTIDQPNVLGAAAAQAYAAAGMSAADIDLAEVHDASSFCELQATELLGFCPLGEGGPYAMSGATQQNGERPINLSGGLESKGHPLGATGLGMLEELVTQLRHEAGPRQAPRSPTVALAHNAGGMVGIDEALCSVVILARP